MTADGALSLTFGLADIGTRLSRGSRLGRLPSDRKPALVSRSGVERERLVRMGL